MLFVFFLLTNSKRPRLSNFMDAIVMGECRSKSLNVQGKEIENYLISMANEFSLSLRFMNDLKFLLKDLSDFRSLEVPERQYHSYPGFSYDKTSLNLEGYSVFFESLTGTYRRVNFCAYKISGKKTSLVFRHRQVMEVLNNIRGAIGEEAYSLIIQHLK